MSRLNTMRLQLHSHSGALKRTISSDAGCVSTATLLLLAGRRASLKISTGEGGQVV